LKLLGRDGQPVSYDWGYSQSVPIVKITNAANTLRDSAQPMVLTPSTSFQLGPNNSSYQTTIVFSQVKVGNIIINAPTGSPTGLPPNSNVTVTYSLTGPSNANGNLCAAGTGGASCGSTPSTITLSNMPIGTYTLVYTANTTFGSYTFTTSMSYSFWGMGITNTGIKEFFYDGFEENAGGTVGTSHTGVKFWNSNYTTSFSPPTSRNYLIQWWNLSGGKWIYNQQAYTNGMVLTGPVDDVRIFPTDAMMSTYTYYPTMLGLATEIGPNGKTLYYSYDRLGRLRMIKDQDGNVVKTIQYHYQNQTGTSN
jgi:YD repeat-containing protein